MLKHAIQSSTVVFSILLTSILCAQNSHATALEKHPAKAKLAAQKGKSGSVPTPFVVPKIAAFYPQNLTETVNQIRVSFSKPMVDLKTNPAAEIFNIDCQPFLNGRGNWQNDSDWTFDFNTKLYANKIPGGTRCSVSLKNEFKQEKKITGKTEFTFQVDGPNIISLYPGESSRDSVSPVNEDQIFVLGLDAEVDEASVQKNVHFQVEGIASAVQVRILTEAEKLVIMGSQGFPSWQFNSNQPLLMLRSRERFPANRKVSLVWGQGVLSKESGLARSRSQAFNFSTRSLLAATFTCVKENAKADCSPFAAMNVSFTAPIPAEVAKQIRLVATSGEVIYASLDASVKGDATVSDVYFPPTLKEKQSYRLELPPGIRDDAGRELANQASFPMIVKNSEFPPLAKFAADFGIVEANVQPVLLPATLRNLEAQAMGQKLTPTSVTGGSVKITAGNFPAVISWLNKLDIKSSLARGFQDRDTSVFAGSKQKPTSFTIRVKENGKAFEVVGIPLGGPGFYVVELQSRVLGRSLLPDNSSGTMYVPSGALVTNLAVHTKVGRESSLFWVTALDTGAPVSGAQVQVFDCSGKALNVGTTDTLGRVLYAGKLTDKVNERACSQQGDGEGEEEGESQSGKYSSGYFVTAQSGNDFSFTHSSWTDGIETYRFGSLQDFSTESAGDQIATSILDRTLLRAGEALSMKHFVRAPSMKGLRKLTPEQLPDQVEIEHVDTQTKYPVKEKLVWDASGSAVSVFEIPKEAKLGLYQITLLKKSGEETSVSLATSTFQVLEFKVPMMRGKIEFPPQSPIIVQPGKLDAQLSVKYQDGGDAVNQPVVFRYSLTKAYSVNFDNYGYNFTFGTGRVIEQQRRSNDNEDNLEQSNEVPLRLNAKGSQVVSIPGLGKLDAPRLLSTQLEFTDRNSETQQVSRSLMIYPSNRLVAVNIDNNYSSPRKLDFEVAVVNPKGLAVAGVKPKFELFEKVTYTHRTRMEGGFYGSESVEVTRRVNDDQAFTCKGLTNKLGKVQCSTVTPESGNYIVQAIVADDAGNVSYGSQDVFVRGDTRAWFPADNNDRMDLIAEKKDVAAGETARLQVQMPFSEATVLVTVEREGVLDSYVQRISSQDPVIKVPIKPEYTPNVYISALVVRGRVSGADSEATATVDLGKPAFKLGFATLNVNWAPNTLKVDVKAQKEVYRPREMATVDVVIKNANGTPAANAEFAIAVVDEGLLQLAKNKTWNLLQTMMARRSLEVETATAQMQVIGKRHYGLKAKPIGGDGGGQAPTRELFDTLVFWQARVKTDAAGRGVVTFPMKDSLTAFKIAAIAHQGVDRFGLGQATIVTQQDVSIEPSIGTLVRNGDEISAQFSARNTTKGVQLLNAKGRVKITYADGRIEYRDLAGQPVTLAAQDKASVSMGQVIVPKGAVKVEYEVSLFDANGNVKDSIRVVQDVKTSTPVRTWMAQLTRVGATTPPISVSLPTEADHDLGGVSVSLKRSLSDGLETAKDQADAYLFQSLESRLSKAVAKGDNKEWQTVIAKLPAYLDSEGYVMYYPSSTMARGSDTLTAYILWLSINASNVYEGGFQIPDTSRERMITALQQFVQGRSKLAREASTDINTYIRRVKALDALARYARAEPEWMTALPNIGIEQVPSNTLVELAAIYSRVVTPDRDAKWTQVLSSIRARLVRTGTSERFDSRGSRPWYLMSSSDVDQLQLIFEASNNTQLGNELTADVPLLMRGAVQMLKAGAWDLTTANAIGSLALKSYTQVFEKEGVSGETQVAVNSVRRNFNWTTGNEQGGVLDFGWPQSGNGVVDITHAGTGAPWALVAVKAAVPINTKIENHIQIEKIVSPAQAEYKQGDVVTVTLKIKAQTDLPMVSLVDPIPAGAKILGSGLDNDSNQGPTTGGWAWPDFQELSYESYRATYNVLGAGGVEVVYRLQVNNAGKFKLPSTRVEAVYMPENFAELPNSEWVVKPKAE